VIKHFGRQRVSGVVRTPPAAQKMRQLCQSSGFFSATGRPVDAVSFDSEQLGDSANDGGARKQRSADDSDMAQGRGKVAAGPPKKS